MTEQEIKELAESIGVSVSDFMCLARSVAQSMITEKVSDIYLSTTEENQTLLAEGYVVHTVKKFEQFAMTVQNNPAAKSVFQDRIIDLLNSQLLGG